MDKEFELKFKELIIAFSPLESDVLRIFRSSTRKTEVKCPQCSLRIDERQAKSITFYFCEQCREGKVFLKIKVRSKKTIKSSDRPDHERGHHIRFYHTNGDEDSIQFQIRHPQELDVRAGDLLTVEIPFYLHYQDVVDKSFANPLLREIINLIREIDNLQQSLSRRFDDEYMFYVWRSDFGSRDIEVKINYRVEKHYTNHCMNNVNEVEINTFFSLIKELKSKISILNKAEINISHLLLVFLRGNEGVSFVSYITSIKNLTTRKNFTLQVDSIRNDDVLNDAREIIEAAYANLIPNEITSM